MSTLTRNDGTEFVMQAYRELLRGNKKTLICQRARLLAEQHGQFVRLLKKSYGEYEAVFSREAGYLLGESIKQYFGQIQNLIFCEALPNSSDALLVVVRSGNVYLDTMVASKNIRSELMPLLTDQKTYQVIISGSVPLKQQPANDAFCLPTESVQSFELLDAPLLPRLPLVRGLQLLPLPLALKAEHLTNQNISITIVLLAAVLIFGIGYWIFSPSKITSIQPQTKSLANIYQAYDAALMTPSPGKQLQELYNLVLTTYSLPGWQAIKITFSDNKYQITVTSLGGDFEALTTWAAFHDFNFQLTPNAAVLTTASHLLVRPRPNDIYSAQPVLTTLIDQLDDVLHEKNISLNQTIAHGNVTEMPFVIHLTDSSPQTLLLVGNRLHDLPISITHIELNLKPGIINGTINLSAWGK